MRHFARFLVATAVCAVLAFLPSVAAEGDYESPSLGPGETFSHTFDKAGSSYYHCHPHPMMQGDITVESSEGSAPQTHVVKIVENGATQSTWGFEPAELTIRAGDTIEWVNEGKADHLVMGWVRTSGEAAGSDDGHDHGDHGQDAHESPAGLLLPILGMLVFVALWRRR